VLSLRVTRRARCNVLIYGVVAVGIGAGLLALSSVTTSLPEIVVLTAVLAALAQQTLP